MADFLDRKRQEINGRIAELKPLLAEYAALERAAEALGRVPAAQGSTTTAKATAAPRAAASTRRGPGRPRGSRTAAKAAAETPAKRAGRSRRGQPGRRKGSGKRAAESLALIQAQPGITIPELAGKMGIKQNYLYRVLPSLEQEGQIKKEGRGWHPKTVVGAGA